MYENVLTEKQKSNYKIKTVDFEKVYSDELFQNSFRKIPKKKTISSSIYSRSAFEENNGFTIIDAPVKIVERNGITTYTLLIERDETIDGKLENLVLYSEPVDGEIGYIIKYNTLKDTGLTEEQIKESGIDELEGVLTDANETGRVLYVVYWVSHCIVGINDGGYCGGDPNSPHFLVGQCGHWEDGIIYIDEGGGGSPDYSGGSGSNTGGDGFSYGGDDEIITSPVGMSPKQTRDKCFDKSLPINIQQWLNTNTTINSIVMNYLESTIDDEFQSCYNSEVMNVIKNFLLNANLNWIASQTQQTQLIIFNYLIANNFSSSSVAFVDEAINYCETNGNTPEVQEETKNILSLLTNGTINGQPVDFGDSTPITNMSNYLSCFNTTQGAILTICADQPDAGDHDLWTISGGVGHSFIIIKQGNKIRSLGFYPISGPASIVPNQITPAPNDFINTPGEFHNNENTSYDVSLSVNISAAQLASLINGTINVANNNPVYNLSSLNCTDMAIMMFEGNTNVNLPSCESPNILWNGQTPGTLGEIIRNLPTPVGGTKDTNGGTSPQNNG